jgi:scyllo-inositol 2-dehydrogenase (NADP+)
MKMPINTGLIGFGLAGRYLHSPLLQAAGFDVRAVVSSRSDEIRRALPNAAAMKSDAELLGRSDIDLVVIATPTQLHATQVRAALAAGKHVIVDKPISATAAEARELVRLARERGRVLAVFQNRRWDNDFLTLRRLVREDRLGEINGYHARWDRFRPQPPSTWRNQPDPASSMLYDLGSHLIDQVLILFGTPDWIQADVFTQRPAALTEDGFEILMAKGTLRITLGVSYLASDGGWRYRVHGSKASYLKAELDPQEGQLRAGVRPDDPQFGVEPKEMWGKLVHGASGEAETIPSERGRWLTFYEEVRKSIEEGTPPPVSAEQAAQIIEIIEAAYTSSREGRRIRLVTRDS